MMYATLPLSFINKDNERFKLIESLGLWPEIYFEGNWYDYSKDQYLSMARLVKERFPQTGAHLPYQGLDFWRGETFPKALERFLIAVDYALLFNPKHFVAHPNYKSLTDSILGQKKYAGFTRDNLNGPAQTPSKIWVERSLMVWSAVLNSSDARLFLENTQQHSPKAILTLLDSLGPRSGFCLDLGHWFYYAMGHHWRNLDFWLDETAPKLAHLHVHDNNGDGDQHLAIGHGLIDYDLVRTLLAERGLKPSMTLENHFSNDLKTSFDILTRHPLWVSDDDHQSQKVS
ncbi:MAG: sugar phosphate isomerase/epimerase [Deltaproteobacteria bacterium]|jgi:hypothetical protein|nr:sugar phosphate isomerase/epimerase [Deltaproteobacteria bacterium]